MSREIKFRFWDKAQGRFTDYGAIHLSGSIMTYSQTFGGMYDFVSDEIEENIVVQQYTGIKDEKGVEIYEGDIVRITYHPPTDKRPSHHASRGTVRYIQGRFYVSSPEDTKDFLCFYSHNSMPLFRWNESEVIGNIYENEELLK